MDFSTFHKQHHLQQVHETRPLYQHFTQNSSWHINSRSCINFLMASIRPWPESSAVWSCRTRAVDRLTADRHAAKGQLELKLCSWGPPRCQDGANPRWRTSDWHALCRSYRKLPSAGQCCTFAAWLDFGSFIRSDKMLCAGPHGSRLFSPYGFMWSVILSIKHLVSLSGDLVKIWDWTCKWWKIIPILFNTP